MMQYRVIHDRFGNEIYLTEERWLHILDRHDELIGRLDDVLDTVCYGQRRQEVLEPQKYRYRRAYDDLPHGDNHIVVIVMFLHNDAGASNNFIVTAWGTYIHPKN